MSVQRVFAASVLMMLALTTPLRAQPVEKLDVAVTSGPLGKILGGSGGPLSPNPTGELRGTLLVSVQQNSEGVAKLTAKNFEVWYLGPPVTPVKGLEVAAETIYPGFYTLTVHIPPDTSSNPVLSEGLHAMAIRVVSRVVDHSGVGGGGTIRVVAEGKNVFNIWVLHY